MTDRNYNAKRAEDQEARRTHNAYVQATGENIGVPEYLALRKFWEEMGGEFYGPNVEHGSMPESKLLPLLRRLQASGDEKHGG